MMKRLTKQIIQIVLMSAAIALLPASVEAASAKGDQGFKLRYINFKTCVEKSKFGKQEQTNFEALKKQMETLLSEKEKTLNDMDSKLNDPDYLDSLTPEAETELKRKFRGLSQEASQQQQQYVQTLQQANFKILEKLDELIAKAAEIVAKKNGYNSINNDDNSFFYDKDLDISQEIVTVMDEIYEKEAKEPKDLKAAEGNK